MHTYRVWFSDGSTTLVTERTIQEALLRADEYGKDTTPVRAEPVD